MVRQTGIVERSITDRTIPRYSALLASAAFFLIAAALVIFVTSRKMTPTGDEPHYLLTAGSLAADHDINLYNDYKNHRYRIFYPVNLARRATFSPDRRQMLPALGLGLSLFLFPFFSLALRFFPSFLLLFLRLVICSTTSIALYHLIRVISTLTENRSAYIPIGIAALSSPLLLYSSLFYPEVVAFLLVVLALRQWTEMETHPWRALFWLSLIPAGLIWLHPKYLALATVILAISSWFFLQQTAETVRRVRSLVFVHLLIGCALMFSYFLFLHTVYGSWSPNRIYGGEQKSVSLIGLFQREGIERLWVMLRMFFAYWLDQRFGLLTYSPLYLLFFPALLWFIKQNRSKLLLPVLALFGFHFLALCWSAQLGGYAPPSRHMVVLVPLILIPMAFAFPQLKPWQKSIVIFWAAVGWWIVIEMLVHYPLIFTETTWRSREGTSDFWNYFHIADRFPLLTSTHPNLFLTAFWSAIVLLFSVLLYPRKTDPVLP